MKDGGELLVKTKKSSSQVSSSQTVKMGWLLQVHIPLWSQYSTKFDSVDQQTICSLYYSTAIRM